MYVRRNLPNYCSRILDNELNVIKVINPSISYSVSSVGKFYSSFIFILFSIYWLYSILDIGYCILDMDIGYWILDIGYWILDIGYWILDIHPIRKIIICGIFNKWFLIKVSQPPSVSPSRPVYVRFKSGIIYI